MSSIDTLHSKIIELATPAVQAQHLDIWGLEILQGGKMLVRLYVDLPSHEESSDDDSTQGELGQITASISQCEAISRQLAFALDAEDLIPDAYTLEVSTPGFNRIFFRLQQMPPYLGDMIEARMLAAYSPDPSIAARRRWKGILTSVDQEGFCLKPASLSADNDVLEEALPPVCIPFAKTQCVKRIHIFAQPKKPGKSKKKPDVAKGAAQ